MNFLERLSFDGIKRLLVALVALPVVLLVAQDHVFAEIYGIKDTSGNFQPRLNITIGNKEVVIKKVNPQDRFSSFAIVLNPKNAALVRNVGMLNMEWVNIAGKAGKEVQFAGPRYDPTTRRFEDAMGKSVELRILDKSNKNLFSGKSLSDLFEIRIDDQLLVSPESVLERDRPVQLGQGRDVSLNLDKQNIVFNESNFKKGEILNIDNRSGIPQVVGIELPEKGLLYYQVIKKPEQTKVPRDSWKKFTISPDSGVFVVMIPEPDPVQLTQVNGKDVIVRVYQGTSVKDTLKVPIRVSSDLVSAPLEVGGKSDFTGAQPQQKLSGTGQRAPENLEAASLPARQAGDAKSQTVKGALGTDAKIWILGLANLALIVALAGYVIFFMLPRIQVLQDRISKSEIFIHNSRESIREEIDEIKQDVLSRAPKPTEQD
ncbi:MAG: hypothetical protein QG577_2447 [Thermodesulfobacteriota bacterium]|nr:hypothetical protein [Thermodesulfobacteriota bacterium]